MVRSEDSTVSRMAHVRRKGKERCGAAVAIVRTLTGIKGKPRQTIGYSRCGWAAKIGGLCGTHARSAGPLWGELDPEVRKGCPADHDWPTEASK